MKRIIWQFLFAIFLAISFSTSTSKGQDFKFIGMTTKDSLATRKDGIYEGKSRAEYISEPYWGKIRITVKNGVISAINFTIRDSSLHETFDGKYEKHFIGNPVYIQQSRNDWKGVLIYTGKLMEEQDINKIDAVSELPGHIISSGHRSMKHL